jgi:activator of HSP90 ATPase
MITHLWTRRSFSLRLASLLPALGFGSRALASAVDQSGDGISRTAESIHQEVVFKASRKRVFDALTDAAQFTKVTELSTVKGAAPASISREAGGAFSCFGGYITGRHIELVSNERLVQAWRAASWKDGVYSIVRFELQEQGSDTKLVFDHAGFPVGQADHLAGGWSMNYWEPLTKFLA